MKAINNLPDNTLVVILTPITLRFSEYLKLSKKVTHTISYSCLFLFSSTVFAGPPTSSIKDLRIMAGNGTAVTQIYANGNMQAELKVFYQLDSNDSVKSIAIKELYTGQDLSGWNIADSKNQEFWNDIIPNSKERDERSVMPKDYAVLSYKYLTTNTEVGYTDVCVELTTKSGSFKSTCDGKTNDSHVKITSLPKRVLDVASWDLTLHEKINNSFGDEAWFRKFTPRGNAQIAYVDYNGAYERSGRTPPNAKMIFGSPSYNFTVRKSQSTLFVFEPNTGTTAKSLVYAKIWKDGSKAYANYTVNDVTSTANSVVFLTNYIFNYKYAVSLNPKNGSTYFHRYIDVYDTYGGKTRFNFVRAGLSVLIR
ncbi:hypothetical protein [Shewanella sp. YLB-07]|uniref:hypothetical protein n=1 Tax=Shewanella sp. YLB-07 TaxID=2601268 RepID=UPI00128BEF7B|nr:hypothetical protein [Shewanella sp. YLB-07]MPY23760.1 hypothetical protein [Shewanella sp. YLB-07]